jgi:DNA-binding CsgD family transcriptional regulator
MKKVLLLILIPVYCFSQNTIGIPDVINYSKHSYKGGLQNWDIKQDKNGIIYIANNEGLLSFDGIYWKIYPLPNKTIVRSVEVGADNRIYVGGQDEFGYFVPAKNGQLVYHSLTGLIPGTERSFGDVWDIVSYKKDIFFRSTFKTYQYSGDKITFFKAPVEWSFLGSCNGKLYAHDLKIGLMQFDNNNWMPLQLLNDDRLKTTVTSIIALQNDSAVITTFKQGLFILYNNRITKVQTTNSTLFEDDRIYAATSANNGLLALATSNNGIYIIDLNGNIIQRFSKAERLQNNNVLSLFFDSQQNLWLGLDNGIDFIAYNSAIKKISPLSLEESGYATIIHDNKVFAGTSNGLYSVPMQPVEDLSFSKGNFSPVKNAAGQVWNLAEINNTLLLGHHDGAFIINNNQAQLLSDQPGFWNFIPITTTFPTPQVIAGNYKGLALFDFKNQQFSTGGVFPGFEESSRFVVIDHSDNIWVSHPYHGVYKLNKTNSGNYSINSYTAKQGLPSSLNNHVFKIKNEVIVATEKGAYTYNYEKNFFGPSRFYNNILGNLSIRYLKEDRSGNIWFIHEKMLGVIDLSEEKPAVIYLPELNNKLLSGFEFIYSVDDQNVFLGGEKGFFHINYKKYKNNVPALNVQVRSVRMTGKKDSLLFGGYFNTLNEKQVQDKNEIPELSYNWKTIHFEFSSTLYGFQSNIEYSFRLKGFDQEWSEWTSRTEKEYTNLPAGSYSFEVKVRNNLGNESAVANYSFKLLPPWYQTTLAYVIYFLLFFASLFSLYRWQRKKFIQQKKKFEEEQQKLHYIHELERSKAESIMVELKNENLEKEISFKNSEMALSAMHLIKKGELLTKIKGELSHVIKGLENERAISEVKKVLKSLTEDEAIDKEWEKFSKHFDKVHSDFLVRVKDKYPSISANELKLCAYLRMNLSTKEIAQLMNISVRGVEISRYRLRKKLGINSEVSLFDVLINI